MVNESSHFLDQSLLVEASVALRAEDYRPLIVVDAVNLEPTRPEVQASLGANETRGACDKDRFQR
jgi:hypothetical protein